MADPRQSSNINRPTAIEHLLGAVFEQKKWRAKLELHRVFAFWEEAVGQEIAAVARPALIRGHVLWVQVADSVWMQQLHLQKILLLEKINRQLHGETISDIRFQLDSTLPTSQEQENKRPDKPLLIDRKKEREFDLLISSLDNKDLQASLKKLWLMMQKKGGGN